MTAPNTYLTRCGHFKIVISWQKLIYPLGRIVPYAYFRIIFLAFFLDKIVTIAVFYLFM